MPPLTPAQLLAWREWVWPAPVWRNRRPYVTDGYYPEEVKPDTRAGIEAHRKHLGVDIMYPKKSGDPGFPRSTERSSVPIGVPALAAYKGKIWSARKGERGHNVTIDHGDVPNIGGVITFYQHLASFDKPWKKGDIVETGEILGPIGGDLPPNYQLAHLHFELRFPRVGTHPDTWYANPLLYMPYWRQVRMGGGVNPALVALGIGVLIVGGIAFNLSRQEHEAEIAFKKQLEKGQGL